MSDPYSRTAGPYAARDPWGGEAGRTRTAGEPPAPAGVDGPGRTDTLREGYPAGRPEQAGPAAPARSGRAGPAPRPAPAGTRPAPGRPRRARLVLARLDPWSVMKLAFLLSIALAIMGLVAVFVLWSVLDAMGVFESVGSTVESISRTDSQSGFDLMQYVGLGRVLTVTGVLSLVNVVLMTALATLGAFLYNLAASLVGGLHVTFSEEG